MPLVKYLIASAPDHQILDISQVFPENIFIEFYMIMYFLFRFGLANSIITIKVKKRMV